MNAQTHNKLIIGERHWTGPYVGINPSNGNWWYSLLKIDVRDVKAGEVFQLISQYKLANDTGWNVEFAPSTVFIDGSLSAPSAAQDPTFGGKIIRNPAGDNVTPGDHYVKDNISDFYLAEKDSNEACFLMTCRARCSAATGGQNLSAHFDQMFFKALRIPPQ